MELIEVRGTKEKQAQECGTAIIRLTLFEIKEICNLIEKEIGRAGNSLYNVRHWIHWLDEFECIVDQLYRLK